MQTEFRPNYDPAYICVKWRAYLLALYLYLNWAYLFNAEGSLAGNNFFVRVIKG